VSPATAPAVDAVAAALRDPSPETRAAAHAALADHARVFGPFGQGFGVAAFDALLDHPRVGRLLAGAQWSEAAPDGEIVVLTAAAPPGAGIGGFRFGFHVDGHDQVDRIEQDLLPAPPSAPGPIALTDAHVELLAGALANGTPMIVAYVDAGGRPHLSLRATVQVIGVDRLAMWIRDPAGGLARGIATNPQLSCFYTDRPNGVTLEFTGRGHVDDTDAVRDQVYDTSPEAERNMDWRKRGVAVVMDLDRVEGRDTTGRVLMARPAS
jgi:hypothetical protein